MDDLIGMLPAILDHFDEPGEVRTAVVFAAWNRAAGESLRKHTIPVRLENKRLTVSVRDDTWKKHLEDLAGQMIFKLNSILGKAMVTFIEFEVKQDQEFSSMVIPNEDKTDREFESEANREISAGLRRAAGAIEDEELRQRFLHAAGNCLVRKKRTADLR